MLANQRHAIDARMKQFDGQGTVRSAAPGTTFTLAEYPDHDLDAPEQRQFLITAVTYHARNNLDEILQEGLEDLSTGKSQTATPWASAARRRRRAWAARRNR